jgi:hypothetical protein
MDPETEWERMISLYVSHRVPEFALALMVYPATMHMMQSASVAHTLDHTGKLRDRPHRRFQDGNDFLVAWMIEGISSPAGRAAAQRLNRIHGAIAARTPHLPGNFDDVDDFIHPLVLLATFADRLQVSLGLPGLPRHMKTAWHHWARAVFRLLERQSGPLADEAFPEDWQAMEEFARAFDARPREATESGRRVATAMMDFFADRWFPAPLRAFGRDVTRCLAGERVCRLHGVGWMSPRRERSVRLVLALLFRAHRLLPDHRTPLPERLRRTRLGDAQLRSLEPYPYRRLPSGPRLEVRRRAVRGRARNAS